MSRTLVISKSPAPQGVLQIPGDKSISHRALIFAALAEGPSEIKNILPSEDVKCTADILRQMGVEIEVEKDRWGIQGVGLQGLKAPKGGLYCGNSGTTMRLMTGLLAAQSFDTRLTGDDSLNKRPMGRVIDPLKQMGAVISEEKKGGKRWIVIRGGQKLSSIQYKSPVASAQVKTAILLAGLFIKGGTAVTESLQSRNHTEIMMQALGLDLIVDHLTVTLRSVSPWEGSEFHIPSDISSAAFPLVATLIHPDKEAKVTLKQVGINPTRTGLLDVLRSMGAPLEIVKCQDRLGELVADIHVRSGHLRGVTVDPLVIPRMIDEVPILAVAAAAANGVTKIRGAEELRVKESDRLRAVAKQFKKLGIPAKEYPDGLDISGSTSWRGAHCKSYGDHRIAMSLAVAGMIAEGTVRIEDIDCIETSFPGFVPLMQQIGAQIEYGD